jgi:hypothetical protein
MLARAAFEFPGARPIGVHPSRSRYVSAPTPIVTVQNYRVKHGEGHLFHMRAAAGKLASGKLIVIPL